MAQIRNKKITRNTTFLIGLLSLLILLISIISAGSYITIKNILSDQTTENVSTILKNSNHSQQVLRLYSDLHRLMGTSIEDQKATAKIGSAVKDDLKIIQRETQNSRLKDILSDISQKMNLFYDQLLKINTILTEQRRLHDQALEGLEQIEINSGALLIEETIAGEETNYLEQLLILIVGYEESLLKIAQQFQKVNRNHFYTQNEMDLSQIRKMIDDLVLRLYTLTASEPEIQKEAKITIQKAQLYKKNLLEYQTAFNLLIEQKQLLEMLLNKILEENKVLDTLISKSAQELNQKVLKTVFFSAIIVFSLVLLVVIVLSTFIFNLVQSMDVEIGKRKDAQDKLIRSQKRLKALSDASFEGIVFSEKGICKDLNHAAEVLLGYPREEAIGMHISEWISPKYRETAVSNIASGHEDPYEAEIIKKEGTIFPCEIQARMVVDKDNRHRISAVRDISDRKIAESEKQKALLLVAEQKKLSLVGQVAGKMAHDFNNVLAAIMGNSELALMGCKDEGLIEKLELILQQTLRGRNLTKNLVAFAHDNEPKQEFFQLRHKIDLVLKLLNRDLEGIDVQRRYDLKLPDLMADSGMVEHLLINLLNNSIHATGKNENPTIFIRTNLQNGYICLEVEDNGCGIPSKHIDSVFEPAFSLKGSKDLQSAYKSGVKGTGYGLANVKKYVTQHKGKLEIDSEENFGTKISIFFPIVHKTLTAKEKEERANQITQSGKKILLVEDESSISEVQARILTEEPLNHFVEIAQNGKTAIELFNKEEYDLISLDYILPGGVTGMDVYKSIRKKDKSVPILFISGNIEFIESLNKLGRDDKLMAHLSKPCQNAEYVDAINQLLLIKSRKVG